MLQYEFQQLAHAAFWCRYPLLRLWLVLFRSEEHTLPLMTSVRGVIGKHGDAGAAAAVVGVGRSLAFKHVRG